MREPMTVREAGRRGGIKRRDSGADYNKMGRKGGMTTRARYGSEHYRRIGKLGGDSLKAANHDFTALSQKAMAAKRKKRQEEEEE